MTIQTDQERYARYRRLRLEMGFSFEQAAAELGLGVDALRDTIARLLKEGRGQGRVSSYRARGVSAEDRVNIRNASRHVAKAIAHHNALEDHHSVIERRIRDARAGHHKLVKTLASLGYNEHEITRALGKVGDALDSLAKAHGEADDAASSAQDCIRAASERLNAVVGSDSTSTGDVAGGNGTL
jgi:hypothetical protein